MAAVGSRYARAFADVVDSEHLNGDAVIAELRSLVATVTNTPALRKVWETPAIPAAEKRALLDAIAARTGLSKPVRNFVAVMIDHRRVAMLPQVVEQLQAELDERQGVSDAEVTASRELSDEERREIEGRIARTTGRRVRAHYATDSAILGGAVVRIGSTIYDGSVRGQLRKIKEALSS
jgi:F-type H+-transporting ATPase subunit delta